MSEPNGTSEPWRFGEDPLAEQLEFAAEVRDLVSTVLSLESSSPQLVALTEKLREAREILSDHAPSDLSPRIGEDASDSQRVYIDHSRGVGAFNPFFPVYEMTVADDSATGTVEFPISYEGPPGLVHGGFLAVFFDSVLQQLNCDLGLTGKTASLSLRYRRPTPVLTRLDLKASRVVTADRINSEARLELGGKVLCEAEMASAIGNRNVLPVVSPRRRL
jgi:hypothetical protein